MDLDWLPRPMDFNTPRPDEPYHPDLLGPVCQEPEIFVTSSSSSCPLPAYSRASNGAWSLTHPASSVIAPTATSGARSVCPSNANPASTPACSTAGSVSITSAPNAVFWAPAQSGRFSDKRVTVGQLVRIAGTDLVGGERAATGQAIGLFHGVYYAARQVDKVNIAKELLSGA